MSVVSESIQNELSRPEADAVVHPFGVARLDDGDIHVFHCEEDFNKFYSPSGRASKADHPRAWTRYPWRFYGDVNAKMGPEVLAFDGVTWHAFAKYSSFAGFVTKRPLYPVFGFTDHGLFVCKWTWHGPVAPAEPAKVEAPVVEPDEIPLSNEEIRLFRDFARDERHRREIGAKLVNIDETTHRQLCGILTRDRDFTQNGVHHLSPDQTLSLAGQLDVARHNAKEGRATVYLDEADSEALAEVLHTRQNCKEHHVRPFYVKQYEADILRNLIQREKDFAKSEVKPATPKDVHDTRLVVDVVRRESMNGNNLIYVDKEEFKALNGLVRDRMLNAAAPAQPEAQPPVTTRFVRDLDWTVAEGVDGKPQYAVIQSDTGEVVAWVQGDSSDAIARMAASSAIYLDQLLVLRDFLDQGFRKPYSRTELAEMIRKTERAIHGKDKV